MFNITSKDFSFLVINHLEAVSCMQQVIFLRYSSSYYSFMIKSSWILLSKNVSINTTARNVC